VNPHKKNDTIGKEGDEPGGEPDPENHVSKFHGSFARIASKSVTI
jgi:hypothetical protein